MKKINILLQFLIVFSITILTNSCEDYLKEEPKDLLVESNSFLTESDAVASIAGVYQRLTATGGQNNQVYNGLPGWFLLEVTSNNTLWDKGTSEFDRHTYNADNSSIDEFWRGVYATISRANIVIEQAKESTLPSKEEFIAEAKFLRSYCYFLLVNLYGDVPLRTSSVRSAEVENVQIPATKASDIYNNVIIPDLEDAIKYLPSNRTNNLHKFRVTKIAAQALLARVFLYNQDWENAMLMAESAWEDGLAANYGLFDNYMQTWGEEYQAGKEHLFFLNYDALYNSDLLNRRLSPSNNKIIVAKGWGDNNYVEPNFYANWPNDFRKQSAAPTGFYNNNNVWVPFQSGQPHIAKHWDPLTTNGWGGNNKNLIRFAEVYLIYAEAANEFNNAPTDKAIEALNTIRQRARNFYTLDYLGNGTLITQDSLIANLENIDTNNPPSKEAFREMVYNERDWEFFGEYQSRLENVRRHRLAKAGLIDDKYLLSNVLSEFGTGVDDNIHHLFPIPFKELQLNPKLQQNLGY